MSPYAQLIIILGAIISQSVSAGTRFKEGSQILLSISKGPKAKKKKAKLAPQPTPPQKKAEQEGQKKVQFAGDLPW